MHELRRFASDHLRTHPRQVQIFTPTPSTYSSLMYHTEKNPFSGQDLFVEKDQGKREYQKRILVGK